MKKLFAGAVICLTVFSSAIAQEIVSGAAGDYLFDQSSGIRFKRGDMTWAGAANVVSPMGEGAETSFDFQATVGYFVTDYVEIEGLIAWESVGDVSGSAVGLGANRYFREWLDDVFPYIGAGLEQWFGDIDGTRINLKAGVRHYLHPYLGLRYWLEFEADPSETDEGVISAFVGIFSHPH